MMLQAQTYDIHFEGKILVADDQHINIEILKQLTQTLGVEQQTTFCVNGQQAIDHVKNLVGGALNNLVSAEV